MDIPIEVVRKGLAEDYIRLYEKTDITEKKLYKIKNKHSEHIRKLYKVVTGDSAFFANGQSVYIGGKIWEHALIIEQLSKELVEIAAEYMDIKAENDQAQENFKLIL